MESRDNKFGEELDRFEKIAVKLLNATPSGTQTGNVNVNVRSADRSMAIAWISSGCCIVMFILALVGSIDIHQTIVGYQTQITGFQSQIAEQNRKIDRNQDYLNAIYVEAPQLKPKDSK